ncbi:hypothetical protein BGX20_005907 [Mortierella sp. AD010]|nr:hypothetical protein BGX20_005907 [Mortierella sp. AD010]
MSQPRNDGNLDGAVTQYQFMDCGLVYRLIVGGNTKYQFLCSAAKEALLEVYKEMPLPIDIVKALRSETVQESDIDIEELQVKFAAVTLELKDTKLELQNTKGALTNSERARPAANLELQAANLDRVHPR